ncbi:hypothetical protein KP509_37G067600 [Ceratopteris richardii]|uniref:Uncharacterized protein n=1 Tax=Ceratopteris richardii TaxID=49495 RepID=A0A8T2QA01_CERRI|nr:hypothetical protein KP509_37G067600 [Ceratopteris richardii]
MASLSRGISFRRQGSSGLSWADTWIFTDEGMLVRTLEEHHCYHPVNLRFQGSSLSCIEDDDGEAVGVAHKTVGAADGSASDRSSIGPGSSHPLYPSASFSSTVTDLQRSRSVGSSSVHSLHKPSSTALFKWIKKTLHKVRR